MTQRFKGTGGREETPGAIVKSKGGGADPLTDDRSKPAGAAKLLASLKERTVSTVFGATLMYDAYFDRIMSEPADPGPVMIMRKGGKEDGSEPGEERQGEPGSNGLMIFSEITGHVEGPALENHPGAIHIADMIIRDGEPLPLVLDERALRGVDPLVIALRQGINFDAVEPGTARLELLNGPHDSGLREVEIDGVRFMTGGPMTPFDRIFEDPAQHLRSMQPPGPMGIPLERERHGLVDDSRPLPAELQTSLDCEGLREPARRFMEPDMTFSQLVEETIAQLPERKSVRQWFGELVEKCKRKLGMGDKEE